MILSLNTNTFASSDNLEGCLRLTKEFGLSNIELWSTNMDVLEEGHSKFVYSGKDIDAAEKLLKEYGINVCCLTFGGGLDREFAKDHDLFAKEFVYAVEVAHRLGAKVMNHYADEVFEGKSYDYAVLDKIWIPAIKKAEELGIVLCLENEATDFTSIPLTHKEVIDHFNSPSFKSNYDPTNYYHSSFEPYPYAYEVLKDDIKYVHFKNACIYREEYCPDELWKGTPMTGLREGELLYYMSAGEGAVPIDAIARRLNADGYKGYVSLEPHTERERAIDCIKKEVKFLTENKYAEV
jgi:sugar phosphate isomerase/epimerase